MPLPLLVLPLVLSLDTAGIFSSTLVRFLGGSSAVDIWDMMNRLYNMQNKLGMN